MHSTGCTIWIRSRGQDNRMNDYLSTFVAARLPYGAPRSFLGSIPHAEAQG